MPAGTHTVQDGENLQMIADKYGVTPSRIQELNRREMSGSSSVRPGMTLMIPGPEPKPEERRAAAWSRYDRFRTASTSSKGIPQQPDANLPPGTLTVEAPRVTPATPPTDVRSQLPASEDDADQVHPKALPANTGVGIADKLNVRMEGGLFGRSYRYLGRAKAAIDSADVERGRWRIVVLHHSETSRGNARLFDFFHRHKRGMKNGLAYHFVIGNGTDSRDGEIEIGPRWRDQLDGGHVRSRALNAVSIGICFVGDFNHSRPSKKQIAACIELVNYLRRRCDTRFKFALHREINPHPTDCPGQYFPARLFHRMFD